ncbi:hypothetical protein Lal_00014084 [Lupinus albus]|nr:hypothetical protein Lal_00014084 [Lupinus albus]
MVESPLLTKSSILPKSALTSPKLANHFSPKRESGKVNQEAESSKGDYRRLTSSEMRDKREKGLYFRCDEPFSRDHRCKNKQFRMLLLYGEDEDEEDQADEVEVQQFNSLQLSLYSMTCVTSTRSWKIGRLELEENSSPAKTSFLHSSSGPSEFDAPS